MPRYYPEEKDMATRDQMSLAMFIEVREGRGVDGGIYLDASAVEREQRETKYRHLCEAMARLGKEFGKDKVVVTPVMHFLTGGIVVDEHLETGVGGLFAAGEAVGGTHGANRLAGNAFAECVVFGSFSGAAAAEYAKDKKLPDGFSKEDLEAFCSSPSFQDFGPTVAECRRKLRRVMWERAGILRTEESLKSTLEELTGIRECLLRGEIQRPDHLIRYHELGSLVRVAEAVVRSALMRTESRGAHNREDFPNQDDKNWRGTVFVKEKGQRQHLWFEPLPAGS